MVFLCSVVTFTVNQKALILRALPPFSLSFVVNQLHTSRIPQGSFLQMLQS
jgi:hypothetical protein